MKGRFLLSSQRLEHGNDLYNVSDVFGQKDRGKEKKTKKKKKESTEGVFDTPCRHLRFFLRVAFSSILMKPIFVCTVSCILEVFCFSMCHH